MSQKFVRGAVLYNNGVLIVASENCQAVYSERCHELVFSKPVFIFDPVSDTTALYSDILIQGCQPLNITSEQLARYNEALLEWQTVSAISQSFPEDESPIEKEPAYREWRKVQQEQEALLDYCGILLNEMRECDEDYNPAPLSL